MNLYRGKRKDNQEWAYGDLISYGKERYILTSEELSKGIDIGGWLDGVQTYEVNAETVGRETDLKDKHGFSVFEGDIIKVYCDNRQNPLAVIRYGYHGATLAHPDNTFLGFYIDWIDISLRYRQDIGFWFREYLIEVIGNRYDNRDLLTKK